MKHHTDKINDSNYIEELRRHNEDALEFVLRRYGNLLIHAVCLIIALFYIWPLIIVNLVYFAYSFIWASPNVLITTEKVSDEGEPLKFSDMDEILNQATRLL